MCGAISTKCATNGCKGMARYSLYCFKCMSEDDDFKEICVD